MSNMCVIAVDPGKNGGIVWGTNINEPHIISMPDTPAELMDLATEIWNSKDVTHGEPIEFWLERITGFFSGMKHSAGENGEVTGGVSPKSMLSFGRKIGHIEMLAASCGVPLREIMPTDWQRKAGVSGTKKSLSSASQWKKYLKDHALKLYPKHVKKITLNTCDALLIYYAVHKNNL